MRHHVKLVIVLSSAALAAGCPSTSPTSPAIDEVVVDGDATTTSFALMIKGRGFTTDLTYDLSKGTGEARSALRVEAFDAIDAGRAFARTVVVSSPREIRAEMDVALEPGVWGVRIYDGETGDRVLIEKDEAFQVLARGDGEDAGGPDADGGIPIDPDADVDPDAGEPDAPIDGGIPDTGEVPDSGLGPFTGDFQYRRQIIIANSTGADAPADTTILIPIEHATILTSSMAKPDATDFALYLGTDPVLYQWDDRAKIGTDELMMVALLPAAIPPGDYVGPPLVLYFGSPSTTIAPTDAVFAYAERADNDINATWNNNNWYHCDYNRPIIGPATTGAYCVEDGGNNPTRRTLAKDPQPSLNNAIAANQIYDLSLWTSGRMISQTADIFYFAFSDDEDILFNTTLIPTADWLGFTPNVAAFPFLETNATIRSVDGWRYPAVEDWWKRSTARFRTPYAATSLHFRFISTDNDDNAGTIVVMDDVTIRVALQPDFRVALGPIERRSP